MDSRKADGPPSRGSARKARKQAAQRSAKWGDLRQESSNAGGAQAPAVSRPSLLAVGKTHWQDSPTAALLLPVAMAVLLVGAILLSLPVLDQTLRPWGLVPLAVAIFLGRESYKSWQRKGGSRRLAAGSVVGVLILALFAIGLATQPAPQGQPLLPGTTAERTYEQGRDAQTAARILLENSKFLDLSAAEIVPLTPLLDEARAQALSIAEAWNPVSAGEPPVPAMLEVRALLNKAAAQEAQALEIAKNLAVSPEVSLAAQLEAIVLELSEILGEGPNSVSAALDRAAQEAGLGERFPQ